MTHTRAVVVGAGFSGLAASIKLAERRVGHVVLERGDGIGGTWRDNTYPGCRCDIPSHLYCFSFAPNPDWSETFAGQAEIKAYLDDVAVRFGVAQRTRFGVEVQHAAWDDDAGVWRLATSEGERTTDLLVLGTGPLSEPALPDIAGLDGFAGPVVHSARWDPTVDLDDRRVAVIGTGASAVQLVPHVQRRAREVVLFQRTPAWVLPHRNRPIGRREREQLRRHPARQRARRAGLYLGSEILGAMLTRRPSSLRLIERAALAHLAAQVHDPDKRRRLTPGYLPGCKRLLPSNDYYPAVDQPNVKLVTEAIDRIEPTAVVTGSGAREPADVIVAATGFHVTDNPMMALVRGRHGTTLAEHWAATGMQAHLGTTVPGFPNLFMLAGPNTGVGHTSLVIMIEAQVRYLMGCLDELDRRRATRVEVRADAAAAFNAEVQTRMARTVWKVGGCGSWYLDDQGRNTTLWPDLARRFVRRTRRFDAGNYTISAGAARSPGTGPAPASARPAP